MAIAITLLNRIEYAVFAAVYFLSEVPLLLAPWPSIGCGGRKRCSAQSDRNRSVKETPAPPNLSNCQGD